MCVLSDVAVICVTLSGVIGRAKRPPHWAVQSRFRVIYIYICLYNPVLLGTSDIFSFISNTSREYKFFFQTFQQLYNCLHQ